MLTKISPYVIQDTRHVTSQDTGHRTQDTGHRTQDMAHTYQDITEGAEARDHDAAAAALSRHC
jgi:DNA-binding GntR family transcriptional regulator